LVFFGVIESIEPKGRLGLYKNEEFYGYYEFKKNHKVTCCRILIKKLTYGSPEHRQQCARLAGEVTEETAKIIIREKGETILKR